MSQALPWVYNDGGRDAAGYKGETGDCVVRSIAIATGRPYQEVYDAVNALAEGERPRRGRTRSSSRTGVKRQTYTKYLHTIGWSWTPTMKIGSGCKVHLRVGELPPGRLVVRLSKHMVAVVDGIAQDTYDPGRDGTRCVYGYFSPRDSVSMKHGKDSDADDEGAPQG